MLTSAPLRLDEVAAARSRVDELARTWLGTPFHDHGRVRGAGCDCATLLLCVFEEAGLIPHTDVGHYSPQWFIHHAEERYLGWVSKFAREIERSAVLPGDIALYKIGLCYAHGAIVIEPGWPAIIHASASARIVRRGDGDHPAIAPRILGLKFFSLFN